MIDFLKNDKIFIIKLPYTILLIVILSACNNADKQNRLSHASSPYLQQHADNPVDWYEWSDEVIAKAKKEGKPLLISIGYASCHWCHVMEKESFMDTAVARLMNDNFICIKVDREERPDIDNIYMNACQLLSGSGGWPLSAFALPDGKPFFAGTYYSKNNWMTLLKQVSQAYKEKNNLVVKQADALTKGITEDDLSFLKNGNSASLISKTDYENFFDSIYKKIDTRNGGLIGSPKFPMPVLIKFLLQYHYLTGNKQALTVSTNTVTHMALGGIYDQVGGGFARYSTDSIWHIPHFEKMLYDNGQLVSLYAHAYQITKNIFFKNVLTETIAFIERDLTSPEGGFYSSLNADTEDGEGDFYAWKMEAFNKTVGSESQDILAEYFNVSPQGNWEKGKNILYASYTPQEYATMKKQLPDNFNAILGKAKNALLEERNKRSRPTIDKKILTAWNAIMLTGYVDSYMATGNEEYLKKALSNARFIEKNIIGKGGILKRNYTKDKIPVEAFLDDYAWTANAFIKLYQVSFDKYWLTLAQQVTEYALAYFYDNSSGLFYYTADNAANLVVRKMEIADNAIPSSNSIMAGVLFELGAYLDNKDYSAKSKIMLLRVAERIKTLPSYYAQWCSLAGLFSHPTYEVAIMGKDAHKMRLELQKNFLPSCIYMGETSQENLPLLKAKLVENKTLIYVCTNKVCKMPVEEVDKALSQIK